MTREVRLTVKDINDSNRRLRFTQAVDNLAKAMKVPLTVKPRDKERGEKFAFFAQADLAEKWNLMFADVMDEVYLSLCTGLELPRVTTFSKAIGISDPEQAPPVSRAIIFRNRVVFNPETGLPIYREDFEKIIRAIERLLNRRLEKVDQKIVLNAVALGRVMARKLMKMSSAEIRKLRLKDLTHEGRNFDWISDSLAHQEKIMGPLYPEERDRMKAHYKKIGSMVEVAEQSMGDHITQMVQDTKHAVRRSIIDGVKARSSKTEIAQDLFNRFGSLNRDWQRIAETETVEAFNTAFLRESALKVRPGDKVYFKRVEMKDEFVCNYCQKIDGEIVLWVDTPLKDDKITDPIAKHAVWDGKSNVNRKAKDYWIPAGVSHPFCRGSWMPYFQPLQSGVLN